MKKCTNPIHLQDSDRTIAHLSIDVCSIFVELLVPEKLSSLFQVTARNYEQKRWQQHLIPLSDGRLLSSNSESYNFHKKLKGLIAGSVLSVVFVRTFVSNISFYSTLYLGGYCPP